MRELKIGYGVDKYYWISIKFDTQCIYAQGKNVEELLRNLANAIICHFGDEE